MRSPFTWTSNYIQNLSTFKTLSTNFHPDLSHHQLSLHYCNSLLTGHPAFILISSFALYIAVEWSILNWHPSRLFLCSESCNGSSLYSIKAKAHASTPQALYDLACSLITFPTRISTPLSCCHYLTESHLSACFFLNTGGNALTLETLLWMLPCCLCLEYSSLSHLLWPTFLTPQIFAQISPWWG